MSERIASGTGLLGPPSGDFCKHELTIFMKFESNYVFFPTYDLKLKIYNYMNWPLLTTWKHEAEDNKLTNSNQDY